LLVNDVGVRVAPLGRKAGIADDAIRPEIGDVNLLAGAERSSALQRTTLALVVPTRKRRFAPGGLHFLTPSTYHRAKLFASDRLA